jgi:hypothetical protein
MGGDPMKKILARIQKVLPLGHAGKESSPIPARGQPELFQWHFENPFRREIRRGFLGPLGNHKRGGPFTLLRPSSLSFGRLDCRHS